MTAKTLPSNFISIIAKDNSDIIISIFSTKNICNCRSKWISSSKGVKRINAKHLLLYYTTTKTLNSDNPNILDFL